MSNNYLALYPFPAFLTPQIPTATLNALSYEQMLRQFIFKLNEVIKCCNSVQEFSESVKALLDEFNKNVSEKVTEILAEMYENGQLEIILQEVTASYFSHYDEELSAIKLTQTNILGRLNTMVNDSYLKYQPSTGMVTLQIVGGH